MKIAVIGAGHMGSWFARELIHDGNDVAIFDRLHRRPSRRLPRRHRRLRGQNPPRPLLHQRVRELAFGRDRGRHHRGHDRHELERKHGLVTALLADLGPAPSTAALCSPTMMIKAIAEDLVRSFLEPDIYI